MKPIEAIELAINDHKAYVGKGSPDHDFVAALREAQRLIAAAPELAEALRSLMEFWDNGTPVSPGAEVVGEARAALAKAENITT